jgi:hypothetical protein
MKIDQNIIVTLLTNKNLKPLGDGYEQFSSNDNWLLKDNPIYPAKSKSSLLVPYKVSMKPEVKSDVI